MKRVFISQPMNGRPDQEIKKERKMLLNRAALAMGETVEEVDSFFENVPHDARPLWFLGKSLELLSTADVVVFADGWEYARGCRIEHTCAIEYGIPILD